MRTRIKICGITRPEDGLAALTAGADYLGFILTESPRRLTLDQARTLRRALPPEAQVVGVFAEEPPEIVSTFARELALHAVQVGGWGDAAPDDAGTAEIWHVLRAAELPDPVTLPMVPLRTYVLDAHDPKLPGGTGKRADWEWARRCIEVGRRLIVAGGLEAANVGPLVRDIRPFGVDASSKLESAPGRKDPGKVRAFIDAVHAADHDRPKRS
ncbi:MAG TPA: phosphoribosylanthranilate isomerase [Candidatus Eisenbacteria bacterium]|nr:phosphoribosylanthranilate isomerase [Candidatus Eisenbacteria bacterium]